MFAVADMGGTSWKLALIDNGQVHAMTEMPNTRQARDLDRLKPAFEKLATEAGTSLSHCEALGISVTEMVDIETGYILPPLDKHTYLEGRALSEIGAPMGLPTFADNDGRAALMGELAHGVGQDQEGKTVLLITLGTGIGVSATVNGDLLRGDHHGAGMLAGHVTVAFDGPRCTCGNIGCAEALVSGWAVDPRLREMEGFADSSLAGDQKVTFGALCDALREGDPFARKAMDHCISVWTSLLVSHCHTLDPSLLILSGGFMRSADLFVEDWMAATRARLWRPENMPELRVSEEPMMSALRGAEVIAKRGLARQGA